MGKSDLSQFFDVNDILTFWSNISASKRRGLGQKKGYFFLGSEFSFLIVMINSGASDYVSITITILENGWIQIS